eukprot:CAMPEP_0203894498 /NCGR_PEP_ID=MMETSP0359-20131031/37451_1 /ASSEMBLY_ACC=CAM_ASM_000338 /TAXON_ID=268821 /ORGANISM="Scrippsiella Hangoei, Strain SHTV-5" /LENGTH=1453 /DNA_ID=CAMNT_0050816805 /DNA_START=47 /DNA_END=4405 /DNA_ORIENTATION=+
MAGVADPALKLGLEPSRIDCSLYQSAVVSNVTVSDAKEQDFGYAPEEAWRAYNWGRNIHGMFGKQEDTPEVHVPTLVKDTPLGARPGAHADYDGAELSGVSEVACALNHMLFLVKKRPGDKGGVVYGGGLGSRGRLAIPDPSKSGGGGSPGAGAGSSTPAASSAAGAGGGIESRWTTPVRLLWPTTEPFLVRKICCGSDHTLALCSDGTMYAWGLNNEGQCGVGTTHDVMRPTRIAALPGLGAGAPVGAFAAGGRHSLLVTAERPEFTGKEQSVRGLLYAWGCGQGGRLGNGNATNQCSPTLIEPLVTPNRRYMCLVAGGESHSGAIDQDANVWTWGVGSYGRLGSGETINTPTPRMISGILEGAKIVQLALGGWHSAALSNDARLYTWGRGEALGLLREGDSSLVKEPRSVTLGELNSSSNKITQVAAGTYHTLLLLQNGDIYAFGLGANGRLGNGDKMCRDSALPLKVRHVQTKDGVMIPSGFSVPLKTDAPVAAAGQEKAGSASGSKAAGAPGQQAGKTPQQAARQVSLISEEGVGAGAGDDMHDGEDVPMERGVSIDSVHFGSEGGAEGQAAAGVLGGPYGAGQAKEVPKARSFAIMQDQLRDQPKEWSDTAIKKREAEMEKKVLEVLNDIGGVSKKEAKLNLLMNKFDGMFARNLKFIKAGQHPDMLGAGDVIAPYLERYEDLMTVLQQQVAYLVSLSMCLDNNEEQRVFYETTKMLYKELEDDRTRHLFAALLRALVGKEIEQARGLEDVFHEGVVGMGLGGRDRSSAFHLLSYFALHEVHHKTLVRPLVEISSGTSRGLMSKIVVHTEHDEVWACSLSDYKQAPQIEHKLAEFDPKELQSEFSQATARFHEFIESEFMQTFTGIKLPATIRKIMAYSFSAIRRRRFAVSGSEADEEQSCCEPILKVVVLGFFVPMLRGARRYGGKAQMGYLGSELEKKLDQESLGLMNNIEQLCKFLEKVLGHGAFDDTNVEGRLLKRIGQRLKPILLKYCMDQMKDIADDIHTQLLFSVCRAHYDLKPKTVLLPSSVLLSLSNMLRKSITKLSINDHDVVAAICGDDDNSIKEFSIQEVRNAKENDVLHVFRMESRFLLKDLRLTVCPSAGCPVPPATSTEPLMPGQNFGNLVKKFDPVEEQSSVFEEIFIEATCILQSTTFVSLKKEFEDELENVVKPGTASANIVLAHRLTTGLEKLAEFIELDTQEEELLDAFDAVLANRRNYCSYLNQLELGVRSVDKAKEKHDKCLEEAMRKYEGANKFSLTLQLPPTLLKVAQEEGVTLRLEGAADKIANREEFSRSEKVRGMSNNPVATHPLKKLLSKKVVIECLIPAEPKDVRVTFHLMNGGVDITILLRRKSTECVMKRISISEERLRTLKKAEEGETVGFPTEEPLLKFSIAKLIELIADTAAADDARRAGPAADPRPVDDPGGGSVGGPSACSPYGGARPSPCT